MKMVDFALRYLGRAFAVIPAQGKQPVVDWRKYQDVRPTQAEVLSWWGRYPDANIALVTGKISGVVVIDVDAETPEKFTPTAIVKSSPGHYHYYYAHPGGVVACSASVVTPHVDVRGDGGIVILPPSIHYNKRNRPDGKYTWLVGPRDASFAPLPEWILEKVKVRQPISELIKGSEKGARNVTTTSVVGSLLKRYPIQDWESVCWPLIVAYNAQSNRPPLGEGELRTIFESIAHRQSHPK
jgi:hypothetical protein